MSGQSIEKELEIYNKAKDKGLLDPLKEIEPDLVRRVEEYLEKRDK